MKKKYPFKIIDTSDKLQLKAPKNQSLLIVKKLVHKSYY